jgi:hypothetical protein
LSAPIWVQLVRSGDDFSAFYSTDGINWTQIGDARTIAMSLTALAGLAVTAHNDAALNIATFTDVLLTPGGGGAPSTGPAGSAIYVLSTRAGRDIGNTTGLLIGGISVMAPPAGSSIGLVGPAPAQTTIPSDRDFDSAKFNSAMPGKGNYATATASRRNASLERWTVADLDFCFANDPVFNVLL